MQRSYMPSSHDQLIGSEADAVCRWHAEQGGMITSQKFLGLIEHEIHQSIVALEQARNYHLQKLPK
jgi:EAL domain-containing protein (putative c-di-GMP-specific phosphodiesterase class I)